MSIRYFIPPCNNNSELIDETDLCDTCGPKALDWRTLFAYFSEFANRILVLITLISWSVGMPL